MCLNSRDESNELIEQRERLVRTSKNGCFCKPKPFKISYKWEILDGGV